MPASELSPYIGASLQRALDQPSEGALGLLAEAYTSEDHFRIEQDRRFRNDWQCIAREHQVSSPGDFLALTVSGAPVLLVRGKNERVRVFANVCRHCSAQVVPDSAGSAPKLVCPYHAWTYETDGRLTGIPIAETYSHIDKAKCGPPELRWESWFGFVYVNLSGTAEPLCPLLTPLAEALASWRLQDMGVARSFWRRNLRWNWKVMVENFTENYHVFKRHPQILEPIYPTRSTWKKLTGEAFDILILKLNDTGLQMTKALQGPIAPLDGLSDDQIREGRAICVFPNHIFAVFNAHVGWFRILPKSAGLFDMELNICLPAERIDDPATTEDSMRMLEESLLAVQLEDEGLCDAVQRGLESGCGVKASISSYDSVS